MIWAIVNPDGTTVIRYDDPSLTEDEEFLKDKAVWKLEKELEHTCGEKVDFDTGEVKFDIDIIKDNLIKEVKEVAAQRILEQVPIWRQNNDLRHMLKCVKESMPEAEEVKERERVIDSIRGWSNDIEEAILNAKDAKEIAIIRAELMEK